MGPLAQSFVGGIDMYTGIPGASAIAGPHPAAQQLLRGDKAQLRWL